MGIGASETSGRVPERPQCQLLVYLVCPSLSPGGVISSQQLHPLVPDQGKC